MPNKGDNLRISNVWQAEELETITENYNHSWEYWGARNDNWELGPTTTVENTEELDMITENCNHRWE